MTLKERQLLISLALMVSQYLENEDELIDHLCMSAGESAVGELYDFGLVTGQGRLVEWADKGKSFLKDPHISL